MRTNTLPIWRPETNVVILAPNERSGIAFLVTDNYYAARAAVQVMRNSRKLKRNGLSVRWLDQNLEPMGKKMQRRQNQLFSRANRAAEPKQFNFGKRAPTGHLRGKVTT